MTGTGKRLHLVPIILFFWFILSFILMYILAVIMKDVEPLFPYISDTGTYPPGSCIFGQLMSIGSILIGVMIYIQYLRVKEIVISETIEDIANLNTAALFIGWTAALGISIVANFQETVVFSVHIIGAIMAFGGAAVYQVLMWRVGAKTLYFTGMSKAMSNFRLVLAVLSMISFLSTFAFAGPATMSYKGMDVAKWKPDDGGYNWHVASTSIEWVCAATTSVYFLTFYGDFKHISVEEPKINFLKPI